MDKELLSRLGASLYSQPATDITTALREVDAIVTLSKEYRNLLATFGGAIFFDNGAKYVPDHRTPFTRSDGFDSVELLLGLGDGEFSIVKKVQQYDGELPDGYVPVAEAPGGNLICVGKDGHAYFWDHESDLDSPGWRIAASLDDLIQKLQPDDSEGGGLDGIVSGELNF